jgi:uncharacterized protein with HEPN domain
MKRDDTVYLHHILDAIGLIEKYIKGMSENEFLANSIKIPDEFRDKHSKLPWGKMTGIRNKIIHEYFNINYAIVWDTVRDDLPSLKKSIKKIIK